ncbi:hypothetical protein [Legionella sp. km535]|uniref:hypothetical protein n=1 Tax=Legionella sp. km535 TaxID=2498107 RepID=UPI001F3B80E8|nr:hypothetical protein [Legionella sp. km535]
MRELKAQSNSEYVITGADNQNILSDRSVPRAVIRIQSRVDIPHLKDRANTLNPYLTLTQAWMQQGEIQEPMSAANSY